MVNEAEQLMLFPPILLAVPVRSPLPQEGEKEEAQLRLIWANRFVCDNSRATPAMSRVFLITRILDDSPINGTSKPLVLQTTKILQINPYFYFQRYDNEGYNSDQVWSASSFTEATKRLKGPFLPHSFGETSESKKLLSSLS